MRRKTMLWSAIAVICSAAVILSGYVYWQYRTAAPPALDTIPIYAASLAVPVTDIPEQRRDAAETQLRALASTAQSGYRVADERFLATREPLTWDALRHRVEGFLYPAGYGLTSDGTALDNSVVYHVYGRSGGLRKRFNDDMIMIAAFDRASVTTVSGSGVHLYGYFRLTPR